MRGFLATLLLVFTAAMPSPVTAQHNHERHHNDYMSWSSGKVQNCCNNRDCGALNDDEVRETQAGAEVKIAGQWCPVLHRHYLTRGTSPDWNTAHVCVEKLTVWNGEASACSRLLCFAGKGGF